MRRRYLAAAVVWAVAFAAGQDLGAGTYLDSTHANATYGALRTDMAAQGYARGHCANCHEQHASVGGSEPAPNSGEAMGPDSFLLFDRNATDQTANFCFDCHGSGSPVQDGGNIVNRSYSYRAGGWTSDTVNDVAEAFADTSAHSLVDIVDFIELQSWGYNAYSNPCAACHNPHTAKGDPANSPNSTKSSGTRGWLVSRPSAHAVPSAWTVWGDGAGEKMSDYAGISGYQAPYRYGSTTTYEPDGSTTDDGSNLTDYVTFCTDCHNATNTIYSTALGRNLYKFAWADEKHGKDAASNDGGNTDVIAPYQDAQLGNYALSCTDCHEPHGSPNPMLVRKTVNKTELTLPANPGKWKPLCIACHSGSVSWAHHGIYPDCAMQCHYSEWVDPPGVWATVYRDCVVCHFHGSTKVFNGTTGLYETYNGGEHLF